MLGESKNGGDAKSVLRPDTNELTERSASTLAQLEKLERWPCS